MFKIEDISELKPFSLLYKTINLDPQDKEIISHNVYHSGASKDLRIRFIIEHHFHTNEYYWNVYPRAYEVYDGWIFAKVLIFSKIL